MTEDDRRQPSGAILGDRALIGGLVGGIAGGALTYPLPPVAAVLLTIAASWIGAGIGAVTGR